LIAITSLGYLQYIYIYNISAFRAYFFNRIQPQNLHLDTRKWQAKSSLV